MKAGEAAWGLAIGVIGSMIFEWGVKPPLAEVVPAIGSILVGLSDFRDTVVQNSATYSENFTVLLLLSGTFLFVFRMISVAISALDFGKDQHRRISITRSFNIGAELFVIVLSIISVYAGLLVHERTTWFNSSITRLEANASLDEKAPITERHLNIIRSEWTQMKSPADLTKITEEIKTLGAQGGVIIDSPSWSS